jgi:hypothetical protein
MLVAGKPGVRFPFVGLGVQLVADGWVAETQLEDREFPGPMRAGAEVPVTLEMSRALPVLTGRALDTNGEPLAERELMLWLRVEQQGGQDQFSGKTDAQGRFRFTAGKNRVGKKAQRLTLSLRGENDGVFARAALPRTLLAGPQDLGDLKFTEAPLIAAGVVVDELGGPVDEAAVGLQWAQQPGAGERRNASIEPWEHDVATRTLGAGRFEVRGELPDGELQLRAQHRNYADAPPVAFVRGKDDLRIVLTRGGSLGVVALVDAGSKGAEWRFALRAARAADGKEIQGQNPRLEGAGRLACVWRGLPADTYELVVRTVSEGLVVKSLPGLTVEPGKACEDPRLAGLDLRGLARRIEITVVDAAGALIDKGGSLTVKDGAMTHLQNGRARLWITRPSVDLAVAVTGFKKKSFPGITSDTNVAMDPGYAVRLVLVGPELPQEPRPLLSLRPESAQGPNPDSGFPQWFDMTGGGNVAERDPRSGEYRVMVAEATKYRVSLVARSKNGWPVDRIELGTISVADTTGEQRFEIAVTREQVQRVVQKSSGG